MADYHVTPAVQDQYGRNFMQLFDEAGVVAVPTLFQSFFAKPESKTLFSPDSNVVDIDIMRANETIAALVPRGTISRKLDGRQDTLSQRYSTFSRSFPLIEEEGAISAGQTLNRVAGEGPAANATTRERFKVLAGREHKEQIRRVVRACELLSSLSILNGEMPAIFGTTDADQIYDWRRNPSHSVTLGSSWFTADHDIAGDIYAGWKLIRTNALVSADALLLGESAMQAIVQSSQMATFADKNAFNLVNIGTNPVPPRFNWMIAGGAIPRGMLQLPEGPNIWLFTYLDGYTNSSGTFTEYMPEVKAMLFYSGAETHRYFGPPERLPVDSQEAAWYRETFGFNMTAPKMPPKIKGIGSVVTSSMFYFDATRTNDRKRVKPRLQAAPIFAPVQTDAYLVWQNAGSPA